MSRRRVSNGLDLYPTSCHCAGMDAPWCDRVRARGRQQALDAFKTLGRLYFEDRAYGRARRFYGRALELDAADETLHIAIMRCLEAVNDRRGVQQQYTRLARMLKARRVSVVPEEAVQIYQRSRQ